MRLITKQELYELPVGSILSYGEPIAMYDLFVYHGKLDHGTEPSLRDDFWIAPLSPCFPSDIANPADNVKWKDHVTRMKTGFDVDIEDHGVTRDGLYEEDAIYWLWEQKDLEKLQAVIQNALKLYKPKEKTNV